MLMPAKFEMTWEPGPRRWRRMEAGKTYTVSCRQLSKFSSESVPETKEGSYQAANRWWHQKQVEISGQASIPRHPFSELIESANRKIDSLQAHGLTEEARQWRAYRDDLQNDDGEPVLPPAPMEAMKYLLDRGWRPPHDSRLDELPIEFYDRFTKLWSDRELLSTPQVIPEDLTIGGQLKAWLARQESRVKAGELSPGRHTNVRYCLDHFREFAGSTTPLTSINESLLERFHQHAMEMIARRVADPAGKDGWSRDYASEVFKLSRRFVRSLWRSALIELPRNLDSREHTIERGGHEPKPMPVAEVRRMLGAATGQLKLHVLLMMNCGMKPKDISDLKDDEVDWEEGRIVRKRSKTRKGEKTPVVQYPLWAETFALLREHRSGKETVLLTTTGRLWVDERLVDGKLKSKDAITGRFQRLQKVLGVKEPLGAIRKASASLLENHPEYGRYAQYFLGQAPKSIAEKHYVLPSREQFDRAVAWLATQYGFAGR